MNISSYFINLFIDNDNRISFGNNYLSKMKVKLDSVDTFVNRNNVIFDI